MKNTFSVIGAIAALVFPFVCETAAFAQSAPLPTGWIAADVGDVGIAGRTSLFDSTWSVEGAGGDIWGEQDAFHVPAVGSDIWGASDEFQFVSQKGAATLRSSRVPCGSTGRAPSQRRA